MNIAIVGAGTGGTKIIKLLSSISDVNVAIVIDRNFNAPGIALAKELGIRYGDSLAAIEKVQPDLIIEATGVTAVSEELAQMY